jgi:hypothetical protein
MAGIKRDIYCDVLGSDCRRAGTAGNSLENSFPEHLAITSRMSANLCPFRAFFNFVKNQKRRGLSPVNKVDGLFL